MKNLAAFLSDGVRMKKWSRLIFQLLPLSLLLCITKYTIAQQDCRPVIDSIIISNMERDGVLLSAKDRELKPTGMRNSQWKQEKNADEEIRAAITRFSKVECSMQLGTNPPSLNGQDLARLGSWIVPGNELESFGRHHFSHYKTLPAELGNVKMDTKGNNTVLDLTTEQLTTSELTVSAETRLYANTRLDAARSTGSSTAMHLNFAAGNFITSQGEAIERITNRNLLDSADLPFFMQLWYNSEVLGPEDHLVRSVEGLYIYNVATSADTAERALSGAINKSLSTGLFAVDGSAAASDLLLRESSSGSVTYQFLISGRPRFVPIPTSSMLKEVWDNNIKRKTILKTPEINLNAAGNTTLQLYLPAVTRDICQSLVLDVAAMQNYGWRNGLLKVEDGLIITPQLKENEVGPVTVQIAIGKDASGQLAESSTEMKSGFYKMPLRLYYNNPKNGDTLVLYDKQDAVTLTFSNYPKVEDTRLLLDSIHKKDTIITAYEFKGYTSFSMSAGATIAPLKSNDPFILRIKPGSPEINPLFLTDLRAPLELKQCKILDAAGNKVYFKLVIPARYFEDNARTLSTDVVITVPVLTNEGKKDYQRYMPLLLSAREPASPMPQDPFKMSKCDCNPDLSFRECNN